MLILIDLLSSYPTYFFLYIINTKNIYLITFYGLLLDFILINTYGIITFLLIIIYLSYKDIKNYYLRNILVFLTFYFLFNMINYINISLFMVSFILQLLFIFLNQNHIIKW